MGRLVCHVHLKRCGVDWLTWWFRRKSQFLSQMGLRAGLGATTVACSVSLFVLSLFIESLLCLWKDGG